MNICGTSATTCPGDPGAVTSGMAVQTKPSPFGDACYILGQYDDSVKTANWSSLTGSTPGVALTLANGSPSDCPESTARQLALNFECGSTEEDLAWTVDDGGYCSYTIHYKTCLACEKGCIPHFASTTTTSALTTVPRFIISTTTNAPQERVKEIAFTLPGGNFLYGDDNLIIVVANSTRPGPVFVKNKTFIELSGNPIKKYVIGTTGHVIHTSVPIFGLCASEYCEMWAMLNVTSPFKDICIRAAPVYYIKSKCINLNLKDPQLCKKIVPYQQYPRDKCMYVKKKQRICESCPIGARCPGGKQLWPLPRFGILRKTMRQKYAMQFVFPCPEPSLRCLGYNEATRTEQCAEGYGGVLCAGCLKGYFANPVGVQACQICPEKDSSITALLAIAIPILILIGILILVFIFALLASYVAMRRRGGTLHGGLSRALDFMLYVISSIILLCQISRKCLGHLPKYINDIAVALAVFELDAPTNISPQCTFHPFIEEIFMFSISIAVMVVCMLMSNRHIYTTTNVCFAYLNIRMEKVKFNLFMCLWLVYPKICNLSLKAIYCIEDSGTFVLASNTLTKCYTGQHILVHNLAWTVLLAHGILFPLASVWYIQGVLNRYLRVNAVDVSELDDDADVKNLSLCKDKKVWIYFFAAKFQPSKFWFRQVKMLMVFVSAVCNEILAVHQIYWYALTYLSMLALHSTLLLWIRPYSKFHQWKLYVCLYSHICTMFYILMNFCSSPIAFNGTLKANIVWLAPLTMLLALFLFVVLVYAFGATLFEGALIEEKDALAKRGFTLSRSLHLTPEMLDIVTEVNKENNEEGGNVSRGNVFLKFSFLKDATKYIEMKVFRKQASNNEYEDDKMFSYDLITDSNASN